MDEYLSNAAKDPVQFYELVGDESGFFLIYFLFGFPCDSTYTSKVKTIDTTYIVAVYHKICYNSITWQAVFKRLSYGIMLLF